MKNKQICSKCESNDIIHIPGETHGYDSGANIRTSRSNIGVVKVDRFVCGACGYIEDWVAAQEQIAKLKEKFS